MIIWIVLALAVIIILVTTIMSIRSIFVERAENKKHAHRNEKSEKKRSSKKASYNVNDYDDDDDDDDDDYYYTKKVETEHKKKMPRRWKIELEDMSKDEVESFIFYNSVGIGRTNQDVSFEKFMSIPDDKRISKVHCSIIMIDDGLYIKDEGSKNHTYLNGKKIQKPVLLQKEDVITIGETNIEVVKIYREAEKK